VAGAGGCADGDDEVYRAKRVSKSVSEMPKFKSEGDEAAEWSGGTETCGATSAEQLTRRNR